jgi:hypothetical protein
MRIAPSNCFRRMITPVTWGAAASVTYGTGTLIRFNRILTLGDPLAIARFVILRVVNSSNNVFKSWPWPHVVKKSLKALPPRSIHAYSFSSIPFVLFALRIVASLFDTSPDFINSRSFPSRTVAVCSQVRIVALATATLCDLLAQTPRGHFLFFSADTSAKPHSSGFSVLHASVLKYLPRAKYLSGQINEFFSSNPPTLAYSV